MTRLNVNPTRMVMTTLKERLKTAERGHKLLKDKQDELMRRFIALAKENRALREAVEKELQEAFDAFSMANAVMSRRMLDQALVSSTQRLGVNVRIDNVMSVRIPTFTFERSGVDLSADSYPYGYAQTSAELDLALDALNRVMDRLLELAKIEKSAQLMANEIESTRRRVNALEYRTIPDLRETIQYIRMKLEEEDRATITRLLKIKDLISDAREGRHDIEVMLQTNE
ncbi:MAG: V-type ATP synthase subunit D [Peptoniphilaceae bacterium]|nr:V-type ATP synthase subunit D [Peptoniphilaceae bacterium]MDY6086268.1 V-type ATP synthase subunit D [Peptoniphilaceae bacterium]